MLLPIALLAAAAPALADVRADYAEGLSKAVRDAVLADQGLDARGFDDIEAADSVDAGNAFFLGIGDPEGYHPYEVECPSDNITWVRPATDVSGTR
jgi:hypothetical protein